MPVRPSTLNLPAIHPEPPEPQRSRLKGNLKAFPESLEPPPGKSLAPGSVSPVRGEPRLPPARPGIFWTAGAFVLRFGL